MPVIEIIAEAGVGHSGSVDVALKMVDAAAAARANVVKFQTFDPEKAIHPGHSQYQLLKSLALKQADFIRLAKHCEAAGIEFMSTPGDVDSLKFLVEGVGVKRIKIGSDDLTYCTLTDAAFQSGLPVILSTGMATFDEVFKAVSRGHNLHLITLLHCVSSYPCRPEDVNLRAMDTMRSNLRCKVGYSDHTEGFLACLGAAAHGAVMIEKHFELWGLPGPDHDVSISHNELADMVDQIRSLEKMLGSGVKAPCEAEKVNIEKYRKRDDGMKYA